MNVYKIQNLDCVINYKFIKILRLKEEMLNEVADPESFIKEVKNQKIKANIFTFTQHIPDLTPKYNYKIVWDNLAVVPVTTYQTWLKDQIHRNARKRIKHVDRHEVVVKIEKLDENLAKGLLGIFNETPVRQGRKYPYYGISVDEVIKGWSPDLDRCDFLIAYHKDEVIGFIKLLYSKYYARATGTVTKLAHRNRAPMTFLVAKAVEMCEKKNIPNLIYGKYFYNNKEDDSLLEFKKNVGFKKVDIPRYYIPLNFFGKILIAVNLHLGIKNLIPKFILNLGIKIRYLLINKSVKNEQSSNDENLDDNN